MNEMKKLETIKEMGKISVNKRKSEKTGNCFAAVLLLGMFLCMASACRKNDNSEELKRVIAALGDEELFTVIETKAECSVLLVTDQFYDSGNGFQASVFCDVYYPINGEAQNIGRLESMGTAYPIAYDKSGMYTAGGHEVRRYVIDKEGNLKLAEGVYEIFDNEGNASYTREKDGKTTEITEEAYLSVVEDYQKAKLAEFKYGAS